MIIRRMDLWVIITIKSKQYCLPASVDNHSDADVVGNITNAAGIVGGDFGYPGNYVCVATGPAVNIVQSRNAMLNATTAGSSTTRQYVIAASSTEKVDVPTTGGGGVDIFKTGGEAIVAASGAGNNSDNGPAAAGATIGPTIFAAAEDIHTTVDASSAVVGSASADLGSGVPTHILGI